MSDRPGRTTLLLGITAFVGGVIAVLNATRGGGSGLIALFYVGGGVLTAAMLVLLYRDGWPAPVAAVPPVERARTHPAPGDAFDEMLAQFDGSGTGYLPDRATIHNRLREVATRILARQRGCTPDEARVAIEEGEWPDDRPVSDFLRDAETTATESVVGRIRGRLDDGPTDFQTLVKRTVDTMSAQSALRGSREVGGAAIVRGADADRRRDEEWEDVAATADPSARDGGFERVESERWRPIVLLAFVLVGVGFLSRTATLVLAGAVPLGMAAYARATKPRRTTLTIERSVESHRIEPGDTVEVTITVRNEGAKLVPDLRLVDGVPSALAVSDGSPRYGTSLRPGESTTFNYSVTARRGLHNFEDFYVRTRGYAGRSVCLQRTAVTEGSDDTIICVPSLQACSASVPLYQYASESLGRLPAEGGEGTAFYATREYRSGDPTSRIDWKRFARSPSEELTTIEFAEEHAGTVALVIESAAPAYLAPSPDATPAVERSIEAARQVSGSLMETGDRVGVAALGPKPLWITPGNGVAHRERIERELATSDAFPPVAPEETPFVSRWVQAFHRRFPSDTQVFLLSSLCDSRYPHLIHQLRAYGHPVTVLSPDSTADDTVGQRLTRLERRVRIEALREANVRVIDWAPDDNLTAALERADTRWSG